MKPKEMMIKGQIDQQDYDLKYDPALLKSKNTALDTYTNMVTDDTEYQKVKQPHIRRRIDHRRVSSLG